MGDKILTTLGILIIIVGFLFLITQFLPVFIFFFVLTFVLIIIEKLIIKILGKENDYED